METWLTASQPEDPSGSDVSRRGSKPLHLCITFPSSYPLEPPTVRVNVRLPHPSVPDVLPWDFDEQDDNVNGPASPQYRVCMDMLNQNETGEPFRGWTPAYSARSVLVQLQSLLQDKKLYFKTGHGLSLAQARDRIVSYVCTAEPNPVQQVPEVGPRSDEGNEPHGVHTHPLCTLCTALQERRLQQSLCRGVDRVNGEPGTAGKCELLRRPKDVTWSQLQQATKSQNLAKQLDVACTEGNTSNLFADLTQRVELDDLDLLFIAHPEHEEALFPPPPQLYRPPKPLSAGGSAKCDWNGTPRYVPPHHRVIAKPSMQQCKTSVPVTYRSKFDAVAEKRPSFAAAYEPFHRRVERQNELKRWKQLQFANRRRHSSKRKSFPAKQSKEAFVDAILTKIDFSIESMQVSAAERTIMAHAPTALVSTAEAVLSNNNLLFQVILCLNGDAHTILSLAQTSRAVFTALHLAPGLWRFVVDLQAPHLTTPLDLGRACVPTHKVWRDVFTIIANGGTPLPRCFVSGLSLHEDVLGFPLDFEVNRKKKQLGAMKAEPCFMSASLFSSEARVDITPKGRRVRAVLPLYLNCEHFHRAEALFERAIVKIISTAGCGNFESPFAALVKLDTTSDPSLSSQGGTRNGDSCSASSVPEVSLQAEKVHGINDWLARRTGRTDLSPVTVNAVFGSCNRRHNSSMTASTASAESCTSSFEPDMAIHVLSVLATTTVLTTRRGNHTRLLPEPLLTVMTQVHRLGLAVLDRHECCRETLERHLEVFVTSPAYRHKQCTPNLGHLFLPLFLSQRTSFCRFMEAYMEESMDRGVLWRCREFPALAEAENTVVGQGADPQILAKTWEARKGSTHLLCWVALHSALFGLPCATTSGCESATGAEQDQTCAKRGYDRLFGQTSELTRTRFSTYSAEINDIDGWEAYFSFLNRHCGTLFPLDAASITDWLKRSVHNSLQRGYHRSDTDWYRAVGTSRLLVEGQKMVVSRNVDRVTLVETWRWARGSTKFLDLSLLLFDAQYHYLGPCDFQHKSTMGALHHSGDLVDDMEQRGTHEVGVRLSALPSAVHHLFIVFSAWDGVKLGSMVEPTFQMRDEGLGGVDMCHYDLALSVREESNNSAIVLGRLSRTASNPPPQTGQGATDTAGAATLSPSAESAVNESIKAGSVAPSDEDESVGAPRNSDEKSERGSAGEERRRIERVRGPWDLELINMCLETGDATNYDPLVQVLRERFSRTP